MSATNPAAAKQARAFLDPKCQAERRLEASIELYEQFELEQLPEPDSEEAQQLILDTRPERYALLASAISSVLATTASRADERGELGLLPSVAIVDDVWSHVASRFIRTFFEDIESLEDSEALEAANRACGLVNYLDRRGYPNIVTQLQSGVSTATETNLGILKLIPDMITVHAPQAPRSRWLDVAKNSKGLSYAFTQRSVENMMAARDTLLKSDRTQEYIAKHVTPVWKDGNLLSFTLKDFENMLIPAGYNNPYSHPLTEDTPLYKIGNTNPAVGCPITLCFKASTVLWNWYAHGADTAWPQSQASSS